MKALSLWQPWASLWLSPRKIHETRSWSLVVPAEGIWIAVHATKKIVHDLEEEQRDIVEGEFGPHWGMELPRGAIIGAVKVVACEGTRAICDRMTAESPSDIQDDFYCGDFTEGRFGFRRSVYKRLATPIPYIGRQSLFSIPDDLLAGPLLGIAA